MIEAPVSRRGLFAFWRNREGGRFQGDLSVGNLKATRRQARRFARTPPRGESHVRRTIWTVNERLKDVPNKPRERPEIEDEREQEKD